MKFLSKLVVLFLLYLPIFAAEEDYSFQEIETLETIESRIKKELGEGKLYSPSTLPYFSTLKDKNSLERISQNQNLSLQEIRDNSTGKLVAQKEAEYSISDSLGLRWSGKAIESPKETEPLYSSSFLLRYQMYEDEKSELNFLSGISYESVHSKENLEKREQIKKTENTEEKKDRFRDSITPVFKTGFEWKF